jgi:hypothetical protein
MPEAVETETPSLAASEYADSRGRGGGVQQPADDAVFVIPDDSDVRIQLTRGADYAPSVESTAKGQLTFTC